MPALYSVLPSCRSVRMLGRLAMLSMLLAAPTSTFGQVAPPPANSPSQPTRSPDGTQGAPAEGPSAPRKVDAVSYPDDPRIAIAQKLLAGGTYEYAKNMLETILKERPDVGRAEFFLGVSFLKLKRYEEARPHLDRALSMKQEFPERKHAHHFLGWASYHLGDLARARTEFDLHHGFYPKEPDTIFGIGLIDFDEDRLDEAEARFQESIDLLSATTPTPPQNRRDIAKAWTRLGDISMRKDDAAKAEQRFMYALELFPDHFETWAKLARSRDRLGKTKEAESARNEERRARDRVAKKPADDVDIGGAARPAQKPAATPPSTPDAKPKENAK